MISICALLPISVEYLPAALAQNTFMTQDQQNRLIGQDENGDFLYKCPDNIKTITIPAGIKFTAESFSRYEIAFCA